jgi:hypothetical protein
MSNVAPIAPRLAKLINETFHKKGIAAAEALSCRLVKEHGEQVVLDALKEMRRIAQFEEAEADAEYARAEREHAETMTIFEGLPTDTTFGAACRIKAAQGDRAAQRWVNLWNTPAYRIGNALLRAAIERHPGWRTIGDGQYIQSRNAPGEDELVEWFYKNHPAEARAIEQRINVENPQQAPQADTPRRPLP